MDGREIETVVHDEDHSYLDRAMHEMYSAYMLRRAQMFFEQHSVNLDAVARGYSKSYTTAERILREALLYGEFSDDHRYAVCLSMSYDEMMGFGGSGDV